MKKLSLALTLACLACAATAQPANTLTGTVTGEAVGTAVNGGQANEQVFAPTFNMAAPGVTMGIVSGTHRQGYDNKQQVETVPNVIAPGLAASGQTCLGSVSGGVGILGFGGTGAKTTDEQNCNAREAFKMYLLAGLPDIAMARVCQVASERKAITEAAEVTRASNRKLMAEAALAGQPAKVRPVFECPPDGSTATASAPLAPTTVGAGVTRPSDPFIARSGRQWPSMNH